MGSDEPDLSQEKHSVSYNTHKWPFFHVLLLIRVPRTRQGGNSMFLDSLDMIYIIVMNQSQIRRSLTTGIVCNSQAINF
jgi:hypothetical protein